MVFFHNHWGKIWFGSAVLSFIISPYVFVAWVLMPAILAPIGFGLINAVCHINGGSRNFPLVNLLSAMGGAVCEHHNG